MRIKCVRNNIHSFFNNKELYHYLKEPIHLDDGILPITMNKEYTVYAVKYDKLGKIKRYIKNIWNKYY